MILTTYDKDLYEKTLKEDAREEGFKEGFKKGALEVAREAACRLRDMGWTPERIQEATGLSGEELKKLFPDEQ